MLKYISVFNFSQHSNITTASGESNVFLGCSFRIPSFCSRCQKNSPRNTNFHVILPYKVLLLQRQIAVKIFRVGQLLNCNFTILQFKVHCVWLANRFVLSLNVKKSFIKCHHDCTMQLCFMTSLQTKSPLEKYTEPNQYMWTLHCTILLYCQ